MLEEEHECRKRVSAPANGLIIVGALIAVADAPIAVLALLNRKIFNLGPAEGVLLALGVLVGCFIIFGAVRMRRLQSYRWAMTASILALIPFCSLCWIVSIPVGIWSLVVLSNLDVKAAFRQSQMNWDQPDETARGDE